MHNEYIVWQDAYSVGVDKIDNQHKDLLTFVNASLNHCTGNKESERKYFDRMINAIIEHLKNHFETEQELMLTAGYTDYETHKEEHTKLVENLATLVKEIKSGKKELDLLWLTRFLRDWVLEHIPDYDKKAAAYFEKGNKRPS
jgi:hemerythrin-like metal-binding protein